MMRFFAIAFGALTLTFSGCKLFTDGLSALKSKNGDSWTNEDYDELQKRHSSKDLNSATTAYLLSHRAKCEAHTVKSLRYKDDDKDFYFEVTGSNSPSKTYILFVSGGLGIPSIGDRRIEGFNAIYIDPLGVGCNYVSAEHSKSEDISTLESSKRIVEVIRSLKLDGNYIIYGQGYGTVIGTVLTHLIENEPGVKPPKALILEGVMDDPLSISEYYKAHAKSYQEMVEKHPKIMALISGNLPEGDLNDLRVPSEAWGHHLFNAGNYFKDTETLFLRALEETIKKLAERPGSEELRKVVMTQFDQFSKGSAIPWLDRMYKDVGCHEIYQGWGPVSATLSASGGFIMINTTPNNMCESGKLLDRPYKPESYKIRSAIHYFQGTHDAEGSLAGARRHHEKQDMAEARFFTTVEYAGTDVLSHEGFIKNCFSEILGRIDENKSYSDVLNDKGVCQNPVNSSSF